MSLVSFRVKGAPFRPISGHFACGLVERSTSKCTVATAAESKPLDKYKELTKPSRTNFHESKLTCEIHYNRVW